ncbi:MAG: SprT family zinc-dependent metalloprotease [Thiolinea sp.]
MYTAAMKSATLTLPDGRTLAYHIRRSGRAKYMRMQYSPDKGLIVTQPAGVCEHVLADWINSKHDWISKALESAEHQPVKASLPPLPDTITFPALNETVHVSYYQHPGRQISTDYYDHEAAHSLILGGPVDNQAFCIHVLQKWTQSYAKYHLGILLQQIAQETGFTYNNYTVKAQKTRWGSCSSKGNINLNYKLLLMPPEWLRYTMIHELCHTQEMNHSKRFWALVEKHMPDYQRVHQEMKNAAAALPDWANHRL